MNYDLNRLANEIGFLQNKKTPIAMYYSRENRDALTDNPLTMTKVYDVIVKNGEAVDFITESNPKALNNGQYKLLVMPEVKVLSDEMLTEISNFVVQGGQVVLVSSSEVSENELLAFNMDGKAQNEQTLKTVKDAATILNSSSFLWSYIDSQKLKDKIFNATNKKVRLIDAKGNDIFDCEWAYTADGIDYLVSITNYQADENVTAYLEVDGKRVSSFTDLRTLTEYDGSIILSPFKPVLLKTDFVQDTFVLQDKTLTATASVIPQQSLDKSMLALTVYKGNKLIDIKIKDINAGDSECTLTLEKEFSETGSYQLSRFLFNSSLGPLMDPENIEFEITAQ